MNKMVILALLFTSCNISKYCRNNSSTQLIEYIVKNECVESNLPELNDLVQNGELFIDKAEFKKTNTYEFYVKDSLLNYLCNKGINKIVLSPCFQYLEDYKNYFGSHYFIKNGKRYVVYNFTSKDQKFSSVPYGGKCQTASLLISFDENGKVILPNEL